MLSGRTQEEIAQNLPARKTQAQAAGAADRVWESSRPAAQSRRAKPRRRNRRPKNKSAPAQENEIRPRRLQGARAAEMPAAIEPMTATLADHPPRGDDWLFEVKWDGVRAIAFIEDEELRLQSRSGIRCERQYPELAVMPHQIAARQAVLDGEIAVLDEKGVSRFHLIQPRIANADPNAVAHLARIHAGGVFRLRPALPGWLRSARRRRWRIAASCSRRS